MKEQSTSKGFAILSAGTFIVKIMSLLYVPLMRAILGDEGYGISAAAYQVYVFIYVITNSGIPVAISKLVSELNATGNYRDALKGFRLSRSILMGTGVVMSALLVVMASPFANAVHFSKAYLSVMALAPAILFTSVASAYRGYFQGSKNMIPTAVSQVSEQVANTVFSIIFAAFLMRYGVEVGCSGSSLGTSVGALISASFLVYYFEKNRKLGGITVRKNEPGVRRLSSRQLVRKIIYYSLPITICVGMTYAGNLVDLYNTKVRLMAGGISETQATILYGYLAKYQQLLNVPIAIISSLAAAILPALSAAAAVKDRIQLKEKVKYSLRVCLLIALPCAVGLGVLSGPVYDMLKFGKGSAIMAYGSAVLILMAVMQIQTTILQGIGKLYAATLFSVIGISLKVTVNYFAIAVPQINILGAILGSLAGFTLPILLNQWVINRNLKGRKIKIFRLSMRPAAAAIFMGAMVYAVHRVLALAAAATGGSYVLSSLAVVISVTAGIYFYLIGLVLAKGITARDLEVLPARLRRFIPGFLLSRIA